MTDTHKALKLALEAFKKIRNDRYSHWEVDQEIDAIKEALAQPAVTESHKQDPVAYPCIVVDVDYSMDTAAILIQDTRDYEFNNGQYWLTTAPPYVPTERQRTWEGLSIFEIDELVYETEYDDYYDLVKRTEALLEEKNNVSR